MAYKHTHINTHTKKKKETKRKIQPPTLFDEEILKTHSFVSEYLSFSLQWNKSFAMLHSFWFVNGKYSHTHSNHRIMEMLCNGAARFGGTSKIKIKQRRKKSGIFNSLWCSTLENSEKLISLAIAMDECSMEIMTFQRGIQNQNDNFSERKI